MLLLLVLEGGAKAVADARARAKATLENFMMNRCSEDRSVDVWRSAGRWSQGGNEDWHIHLRSNSEGNLVSSF